MSFIKKTVRNKSLKNILNNPLYINENGIHLSNKNFQINSFRLKRNSNHKNIFDSKQSKILEEGNNFNNREYNISTDVSSKKSKKINLNFDKIRERKTKINYDLINSCKAAIRLNLPNFKEIISKINKEFKLPEKDKLRPYDNYLPPLTTKNIQLKSFSNEKNNISYAETNANEVSSFLKFNSLKKGIKYSSNKSLIPKNKTSPIIPLYQFDNSNNNSIINKSNIINNKENKKEEKISEYNSETNCILTPEELKENASKLEFLKKYADDVHKARVRRKRKKVLISAIRYLSSNNILVKDFVNRNILPKKPFELKDTEEFLDGVKFNNLEIVKQALEKNINLIFQYDYFKQTSFHWAAKLGHYDILQYLLENGKTCNLYDNKMRTPIYLASLYNHKDCVQLLLNHGGNAYIADINGKLPSDVTTNKKIKEMLLSSH